MKSIYNEIQKVRFVLNEYRSTKYPFYKEDEDARNAFDSFVEESDIEAEDKTFFELNYKIKNDNH